MKPARLVAELALVGGAAAVPLTPTPLIPMVIAASLILWIGGRSWLDVGLRGGDGTGAMIGLGVAIGAVAFAALALVDPASLSANQPVSARGSLGVAAIAGVLAATAAFAAEMVRGFVISRLIDLTGRPAAAVAIAAIAWGAIFGLARPAEALGLAIAGAGFGLLYLAGGKRMALPIAAHLTFEVGAVIAAAAQLSG